MKTDQDYYGRFNSPGLGYTPQTTKNFGLGSKLVILLTILFVCIGLGAAAQTSDNHIILKGEVINADHADIYVYQLNVEEHKWEAISVKEHKGKYRYKLDPAKEYQIWFMSGTSNKILCLKPNGETGKYYYSLDVDFASDNCCVIYKQPGAPDYVIELLTYEDAKLHYTLASNE